MQDVFTQPIKKNNQPPNQSTNPRGHLSARILPNNRITKHWQQKPPRNYDHHIEMINALIDLDGDTIMIDAPLDLDGDTIMMDV